MSRGRINRQKIQDYSILLSRDFDHVLLSWATGVGKSLAAIKIIQDTINRESEKGDWNRWYIVCAEKQHITNWEDEFKKHGYSKLLELGYVEIFCYQSLHKYKDKQANLILDEAHGVTDLRLDILKTIKAQKIISLSATVEPSRRSQLEELRPLHQYNISIDKAIEAGILPEPKIIKVEFNLAPALRVTYDNYTTRIEQEEQFILEAREKLELAVAKKNQELQATYDRIIKAKDIILLKLRVGRKNLLANAKTTTVQRLVNSLRAEKKRLMVFTGSSYQCSKIGGQNRVLSDFSSKENLLKIERFNKGELDLLVALKMLRQGTNLTNVDGGIIVQLDSKPLSFIQMMGRIFRSTKPELFVFVAKDTVDEKYWNRCTEGISSSYISTFNEYHEKKTKNQ